MFHSIESIDSTLSGFHFISSVILSMNRFPTRYTMVSYKRTYLLSNLLRFVDNPRFYGRGRAFRLALVCRHSVGIFLLPSLVRAVPAQLNWRFCESWIENRPSLTRFYRNWEEEFRVELQERRKRNKVPLETL